jgi:hypothetical protein
MVAKKQWKVTYHLLFEAESEPCEFTCDFYYIETALEFLKRTAEHQNLLDFKVERLTTENNNGKILSEVE